MSLLRLELMSEKENRNLSALVKFDRSALEILYCYYNHRDFVHPDPLEFLYSYEKLRDREIVGVLAASLAYGRVAQILKSVACVLDRMGPYPHDFLKEHSRESLGEVFSDFKHRFTTGAQVSSLLINIRKIIHNYGSLQDCFIRGMKKKDETVLPALDRFAGALSEGMADCGDMFVPTPVKGSACKRLNLFLRWMVRRDDVDPGGWEGVRPSKLIIPLDTHMYKLSLALRLTQRKQADMKTAVEITNAFKSIAPEDPVRYDFSLTRLGIRDGMDLGAF
jgi:uncharacterized protein (TIGR02757 family)